ncbi:hypothetical protein DVA67_017470 [Solirubrobacter sp. CPCC 204708]|uniref:DUF11 domain-containing protein n=1 Tax=Solirubrobacter deserti TaxID=2282478 RepID=A0ABT4RD53_9ACTN|nr:hypothetical protein [Solirubrobacter deserti]MBE2317776.1 hypothetical protein [Solirubrobacter deserti]MDA0136447.1 hypothetical protein [Solirubrobacter deserti]
MAVPASAQRHSPSTCAENDLLLSTGRDRTDGIYSSGELVTYTVSITNQGARTCDVEKVNVFIRFPGPDGKPAGPMTRVTTDAAYPAGTPKHTIGTFTHRLVLNPGVKLAQAEATITNGMLQSLDGALDPFNRYNTVSLIIVPPTLTIDKKGSIETGVGPQNVDYTYEVRNTSKPPIPLSQVAVEDDICTNPVYRSGDNGDGQLAVGEVYIFTCSMLHQAPGSYTNTAKACAYNALDPRPESKVCSPPDTWTVVLTNPPGNPPASPPAQNPPPVPAAGVKPANATQAPCEIASPTGLTVRAGELTTIRVRVRNVDAGTQARITLPGGKVLRANTNSSGTATFRVRPTKSGRATIRVAQCSDVARFTVRQPRQVQSRRTPRVTG